MERYEGSCRSAQVGALWTSGQGGFGHRETELKKVGFEAVLTDVWKSVFYHPTKKLLLVVYVDDFKLAGPKQNIKEGWGLISPETIGRYFGCMHKEVHNIMLPKDAHPFDMCSSPKTRMQPQLERRTIGISILRTC